MMNGEITKFNVVSSRYVKNAISYKGIVTKTQLTSILNNQKQKNQNRCQRWEQIILKFLNNEKKRKVQFVYGCSINRRFSN